MRTRDGTLYSLVKRLIGVIAAGIVVALILGYALWRDVEFRSCMQDWASGVTDRSNSLSGPSNSRVDLFFQAYTEAAGALPKPLTSAQREKVIDGLDKARKRYTVIPAHDALGKQTDGQILSERDLVRALHANGLYQIRSKANPVPDAPTCGGLF